MPSPRDVLNRLRYTGQSLEAVTVEYIHRGAPGDRRVVRASDIREVGRSFFTLEGRHGPSSIPWHRVVRIRDEGAVHFERVEK